MSQPENIMTREKLVAICEDMITAVQENSGYKISSALKRELREVAATAKRVSRDWWEFDVECGCLISTRRHDRGLNPNPYLGNGQSAVQGWLGTAFLGQLDRYQLPFFYWYEVVD